MYKRPLVNYNGIITEIQNSDNISESLINYNEQKLNGILNPELVNISFNFSTKTFTVSGNFSYRNKGLLYNKSSAENIVMSSYSEGYYFLYYIDDILAIGNTSTYPDFYDVTFLCYIYINSTNYILFNERHTIRLNPFLHKYFHNLYGAVLSKNGFNVTGSYLVASGTGGVANVTHGISSGILNDEDIEHNINELLDNNGVGNQYTIIYRTGVSGWRWTVNNIPLLFGGTNNIQYNGVVSGSYQLTELTANNYINYYLVVTGADSTNNDFRFMWIMGQKIQTTLTNARNDTFSILDLSGFPALEYKPLYKFIMRRSGTYSTASGRSRIEEIQKLF